MSRKAKWGNLIFKTFWEVKWVTVVWKPLPFNFKILHVIYALKCIISGYCLITYKYIAHVCIFT